MYKPLNGVFKQYRNTDRKITAKCYMIGCQLVSKEMSISMREECGYIKVPNGEF